MKKAELMNKELNSKSMTTRKRRKIPAPKLLRSQFGEVVRPVKIVEIPAKEYKHQFLLTEYTHISPTYMSWTGARDCWYNYRVKA